MAADGGEGGSSDGCFSDNVQKTFLTLDAGRVEKRSQCLKIWRVVDLLARMDLRWIRTKRSNSCPRDTRAWVGKGDHIELVRGRTKVIYKEGECVWTVQLDRKKVTFRTESPERAAQWVAALQWRVCSWDKLLRGQGPNRQDRLGTVRERGQASWPLRIDPLRPAHSAKEAMDTMARLANDVMATLPVVGPAFSALGFALEVASRIRADFDGLAQSQSGLERVAQRTLKTLRRALEQQPGCRLEELSELMGVIEEGARQLESFEFQSTVNMMVHGVFEGKTGPAAVAELVVQCESRLGFHQVNDTNEVVHNIKEVVHNTQKTLDDMTAQMAKAEVQLGGLDVQPAGILARKDAEEGCPSCIPTCPDTVGQDSQLSVVKSMILSHDTKYVVIWGMGGLGKTTLARSIIGDQDVKHRFKKNEEKGCLGLAFVVISQKPDILDRQKRIWEALLPGKGDFANAEDGRLRLEAALQGKIFFLVLDDLWDEDDMINLDIATPSSRVLITSRNDRVACWLQAKCHHVMPLDDTQSRHLFNKCAFPGSRPKKWQEKHISNIVAKCAGLPLAIEMMGKVSRTFKEPQHWQNAIQLLTTSKVLQKNVFDRVFDMSFNSVDSIHQGVLLNLSMLPEDHRARATDVVELHTCIGSCSDERTVWGVLETLEARALIKREGQKFYEVPEFQPSPGGVCYYMHDVVRDCALRGIATTPVLQRRRLVSSQLIDTTCRDQTLAATIFSTSQRIRQDQPWHLHDLDMPKLQALVLRDAGVTKLPLSLLTSQLLAIDLTSSGITELPSQISSLRSAQLLRVDYCRTLHCLPSEVGEMVELRVLSARGCRGIYEIPKSLENLTRLSKMLIPGCGIAHLDHPDMKLWHNLRMLDLSSCVGLQQLPSDFGDLKSLTNLNLGGCWQLECLPSSFGRLVCLQVLILHNCRHLKVLPDSMTCLVELEELDLQQCRQLVELPTALGTCCWNLKILRLQGASCMAFPHFVESLQYLEVLGLPSGCEVPDDCKQHLKELEVTLEEESLDVYDEDLWKEEQRRELCGAHDKNNAVHALEYTPLHWAAEDGMDKMAKYHLRKTNVDCRGEVGLGGSSGDIGIRAAYSRQMSDCLAVETQCCAEHRHQQVLHLSLATSIISHSGQHWIHLTQLGLPHYISDFINGVLIPQFNVTKADCLFGRTPLYMAALNGHTSTAALLLEHGAAVNACEEGGQTPLYMAAWGGHTNTVELLLQHKATVDASNKYCQTPLCAAALNGHTTAAAILLKQGANVDEPNKIGKTPLFMAARSGKASTVALLLEHDATVDVPSKDGWTPFYAAARYGHTNTLELLSEHGATVDAPDKVFFDLVHTTIVVSNTDMTWQMCIDVQRGKTPLMAAAEVGKEDTVELLLGKGARPDLADEEGRTAAAYAKIGDYHALAEKLESVQTSAVTSTTARPYV